MDYQDIQFNYWLALKDGAIAEKETRRRARKQKTRVETITRKSAGAHARRSIMEREFIIASMNEIY